MEPNIPSQMDPKTTWVFDLHRLSQIGLHGEVIGQMNQTAKKQLLGSSFDSRASSSGIERLRCTIQKNNQSVGIRLLCARSEQNSE
tara:strand:+ start:673 stop:930 length:258 start_codon:yes stop_codon:yes gene_type:complete